MINKTALREAALCWIRQRPKGEKFTYSDVYKFLETTFPDACSQRGDALNEPRYKHDARAAVWDAMPQKYGLIRHTGIRGQRQRV
jgi:hypothetical protein